MQRLKSVPVLREQWELEKFLVATTQPCWKLNIHSCRSEMLTRPRHTHPHKKSNWYTHKQCIKVHTSNRKSSLQHQSDRCSSCSKAQGVQWLCCMFHIPGPPLTFSRLFFPTKWWPAPRQPQIDCSLTSADSKSPLFSPLCPQSFRFTSAAQWWWSCIRAPQGITPQGPAIVTVHAMAAISSSLSSRMMQGPGTVITEPGDGWWRTPYGFLLINVCNDTTRFYNWE